MGLPAIAAAVSAVGSVAGGVAAYGEAQGQKELADQNAYIGRTRAIQTDASAREGLTDELATMRTVFAQNSQNPNVGTVEIMNELRNVRSKERRIEFANRMQEAAGYRQQARNYGTAGRAGLMKGIFGAAPSLFDLYEYTRP